MAKLILALLLSVTLFGCVDGNTGKIYLCPSEKCKVGP